MFKLLIPVVFPGIFEKWDSKSKTLCGTRDLSYRWDPGLETRDPFDTWDPRPKTQNPEGCARELKTWC